jgi:HPt (histidine-containing phosphotransfer) domain-containing protein
MGKLPPDRQHGRARVLLTIGVFVAALLLLLGLAALIAPPVIEQSRRLAGYLSHASPETEVARVLEEFVGPSLFKQQYPNIQGETYKNDLAAFREQGVSHTSAYHDFPSFQAAAEGGFLKHFLDAEKARLRAHLLREGTASREFEQWFLTEEIPRLRRQATDKEKQAAPLARAAATAEPEVLLALARQDPATHAQLREDWLRDTVAKQLAAAPTSPNSAPRCAHTSHQSAPSVDLPRSASGQYCAVMPQNSPISKPIRSGTSC